MNKNQLMFSHCKELIALCKQITEIEYQYVKPQFLIDDDDEYQDALEASWENSDNHSLADSLKDNIKAKMKSIKELLKQF